MGRPSTGEYLADVLIIVSAAHLDRQILTANRVHFQA